MTAVIHFEHEQGPSPEAAVIIPLYNYEGMVEQALESVWRQTFQPLELVICEDRSTDQSLNVARRWLEHKAGRFSRAVLLQNEQNKGLAGSRNAAIGNAKAPFVLPLDADNILYPRCVQVLRASLLQSDAAFAYPMLELFCPDQEVAGYACTGLIGLVDWAPGSLHTGNAIDAMVMHRKSALAEVGAYREDAILRLGWEDFDLWFRYARAGKRGLRVHQILARYRVHAGSMLRTQTDQEENRKALWAEMRRAYPEFFPKESSG